VRRGVCAACIAAIGVLVVVAPMIEEECVTRPSIMVCRPVAKEPDHGQHDDHEPSSQLRRSFTIASSTIASISMSSVAFGTPGWPPSS
jgi:hypothetical protein